MWWSGLPAGVAGDDESPGCFGARPETHHRRHDARGWDVQLTAYAARDWRATFFPVGIADSIVVGTALGADAVAGGAAGGVGDAEQHCGCEGDRFITKVDIAWNEAWTGTEQVRFFKFSSSNKLMGTTAWMPDPNTPGNPEFRGVSIWRRVKRQ